MINYRLNWEIKTISQRLFRVVGIILMLVYFIDAVLMYRCSAEILSVIMISFMLIGDPVGMIKNTDSIYCEKIDFMLAGILPIVYYFGNFRQYCVYISYALYILISILICYFLRIDQFGSGNVVYIRETKPRIAIVLCFVCVVVAFLALANLYVDGASCNNATLLVIAIVPLTATNALIRSLVAR